MNMDKAKAIGIEAYRAEQNAKIQLLEHLLANYDDGRRKSFFCLAVNLFELADGQAILEQLACEVDPAAPIKEKAKAAAGLFQAAADDKGMILKLRK